MTLLLPGIFYPGGGYLFREIDRHASMGLTAGLAAETIAAQAPDANWKYVLTMGAALTVLLTSVCDKAWLI
jgi:hypothetical protein